MQIVDDISYLSDEKMVLLKSISIGTNLEWRSRYYLMQQTYKGEEKKLLKFFGFSSKEDFKDWRDRLNEHPNRMIEWTVGFLFKFYDDDHHYTLVDKNGKEPKRFI
jgi:hypothetical protein